MPAVVRSVMLEGNERYIYKLYTKDEVKRSWKMLRRAHNTNIVNDAPYIMCKVKDEAEALTLAALIMRKADIPPACTHYQDDVNLLFINGKYLDLKFDDINKHCAFIFKIYLGKENLADLERDLKGEPLFWHSGTDVETFYKNRNFPHGTAPITPKNIHARNHIYDHIPPEFAGII